MKKIICFDLNGTLIEENSWEIFTCGDSEMEKEIESIFKNIYFGKILISKAWELLTELLKKTGRANKNFIYNCWQSDINFKEGARDLIKYLKNKEYKIYIISCSFDEYIDFINKKLELDGFYAGSSLEFDNKGELKEIKSNCDKAREFKEESLTDLAKREGVSIEDIIYVGDGDNDIGVFKMTKHGIAIDSSNEELNNNSWKKIKSLLEIKEII